MPYKTSKQNKSADRDYQHGPCSSMPNCGLGTSTHPEGSATVKKDKFSVWLPFSPKANAELVTRFNVALHASSAKLPILTSEFE
jgi:hypothetical protein